MRFQTIYLMCNNHFLTLSNISYSFYVFPFFFLNVYVCVAAVVATLLLNNWYRLIWYREHKNLFFCHRSTFPNFVILQMLDTKHSSVAFKTCKPFFIYSFVSLVPLHYHHQHLPLLFLLRNLHEMMTHVSINKHYYAAFENHKRSFKVVVAVLFLLL